MAKVNAHLLAFNRGEVSKLALARIDLAKMALATEVQVNWMPFVIGPAMLRPGLKYIGEIASDNPCKLVDFLYAPDDTALIELTDSTLRVWISDALVARVAVATAVGDPSMSGSGSWTTTDTTAGCTATVTGGVATLTATARGGLARIKQTLTIAGGDQNKEHGLRVVVPDGPVTIRIGSAAGLSDYMAQTAIDTGTHSLVFTPTSGSAFLQVDSTDARAKLVTSVTVEAAGTLTLPTPWAAADLPNLRWTQSKDVIYVAAYGKQPYKIERRGVRPGARGWSVVAYRQDSGPFLPAPTIAANLTPSVFYGNGTLTSDRPFFQSGHVGALFQLFSPGQNNQAVVGAASYFTEPIRITGVDNDRIFGWTVAGTFSGKVSLQRSLVGADSGFTSVEIQGSSGATGTSSFDDTATLNNVVAWYRAGFVAAADYTSGAATLSFTNTGGGLDQSSGSGAATGGGGRNGICRVTGYTSPTSVSIEVLADFSSLAPTLDWAESAWSGVQGWPSSVCLQENRLTWLGAAAMPLTASESGNYTGFAEEDAYLNSFGDAGAILEDFGEGPSDRINWALPLSRLLAGCERSISSIRSSNFDTPLTPDDAMAKDCSQQGAARLAAVKLGKRGAFVAQSGDRVYELAFNPQAGDYDDRNLTRFNQDIAKPGLLDSAVAVQPDTMIYWPRADGEVACLLYDPNDEVEAWWRLLTLGRVENVRVLPRSGGGDDLVYFCVKRTINNVTKRFLERFTLRSDNVGGLLSYLLDCHVSYSGAATNTITAAQLPNTLVAVWADGAFIGTGTTDGSGVLTPLPDGLSHANIVMGLAGATVSYAGAAATTMSGLAAYNGLPGEFFADQQPSGRMIYVGTLVPSGGAVTLPNGMAASSIVGFFGFMAPLMSAKLGYGAQLGSPLTQRKKIDHLGLVLYNTGATAITFGQRFDVLDPLPLDEDDAAVAATAVWSEYDQPMVEVPGEWSTDARLCVLGQAPLPATLGALVVGMVTDETPAPPRPG